MIKEEIYHYSRAQLIDYLRNEAGSSNPDYFHCKKPGGLKLQQVPEEYADLLLLLKDHKIKTYLELGIGNGGSFAMACFFMKETLEWADAVDSLAYGDLIGQNQEEILQFMGEVGSFGKATVGFHPKTTDDFFKSDAPVVYGAAFIDADHTYDAAKRDYLNTLKHVEDGSLIIFHDINSQACPGIMKLWKEVKDRGSRHWEFIHSKTCGIGVIEI